jgi:amino acid transporter
VNGGSEGGLREAAQRKGSLLRTVSAVAWSFFGVRRGSGLAEDVEKINPVHLVIVGLACAALFVVSLIALVRWVIDSGVAAG